MGWKPMRVKPRGRGKDGDFGFGMGRGRRRHEGGLMPNMRQSGRRVRPIFGFSASRPSIFSFSMSDMRVARAAWMSGAMSASQNGARSGSQAVARIIIPCVGVWGVRVRGLERGEGSAARARRRRK